MEKIIMLIDDDKDDRYLFTRAAQHLNAGIMALTAEGGNEALAVLRDETNKLPHAILLDINMPGMTGWEFLKEAKKDERLKKIPIIMYSTSSHDRDVSMAAMFGAVGYCVKPDDYHSLEAILNFVNENLDGNLEEAIQNDSSIKNFRRAEPFIK